MTPPVESRATNWVRGVLMVGFVAVFGVLIWQLWNLDPVTYCSSVFNAAAKSGNEGAAEFYVGCVIKLIGTKNIVVGGCLAIIGVFVIAHVIRDTKVIASISAPGGLGASFGTAENPAKVEVVNTPAAPVPTVEKPE